MGHTSSGHSTGTSMSGHTRGLTTTSGSTHGVATATRSAVTATTTATATSARTTTATTTTTSSHVTSVHVAVFNNAFAFRNGFGFHNCFFGHHCCCCCFFGFGFNFGFPFFPCFSSPTSFASAGPAFAAGPYLYSAVPAEHQFLYPSEPPAPGLPSAENTAAPERTAVALIDVRLPVAGAEVWIDGKKTTQTGDVRFFESPPLAAGRQYVYEVRASWTVDGEEVTKTRRVTVRAGDRAVVDFTVPPRKEAGPDKPERIR
jgi:uncharacterized protein (TIGR03000 family)